MKSFSIVVFFLLFSLNSCQNGQQRLMNNLESFVDKVEKNNASFSNSDWRSADDEMNNYQTNYEALKDKLTIDEKVKINELIGKYMALRVRGGINDFTKKMIDYGNQVNGAIKKMIDTTSYKK